MKKNLISIALLAVLTGMTVSCQKEILDSSTTITENGALYTMQYAIDGVQHSVTIHNDFEERALMQELIMLAFDGSEVVVYDENSYSQSLATKDTQIFTTPDKEKAAAWSTEMIKDGYKVTVDYDEKNGLFVCLAVK